MFESKKTQILIEFLDGTKKVQLAGKKSFLVAKKSFPLGLEDVVRVLGKFTTPHVMLESKKKTQILKEFLDGTKKVQLICKKSFLVAKKSSPRV